MKKIKVSTFAVIALLLGIVGSAFTPTPSAPPPGSSWYEINTGDPAVAANYHKVSTMPSCPQAPSEVCAIFASDDGTQTVPTQADVNTAKAASSDFTEENDLVRYRP